MKFLIQKNLPSPVKFVWKTLVVFILSALLFFPTPVLALDYSGDVQSYISNVKVDLDSVLGDIKKLRNLSYEQGKTALAQIDTRLQTIQTNARENATKFQKLSDQLQQEYQENLNKISKDQVLSKYAEQLESDFSKPYFSDRQKRPGLKVEETAILYEGGKKYCQNQGYNTDDGGNWVSTKQPFPSCLKDYLVFVRKLRNIKDTLDFFFPTDVGERSVYGQTILQNLGDYGVLKTLYTGSKDFCQASGITTVSSSSFSGCADSYFRLISKEVVTSDIRNATYYIMPWTSRQTFETNYLINSVRALHYLINIGTLQEGNKKLANSITLTSKISKLCDNLEKRIKLANQKYGTVKEYADHLKSFSDPIILDEISELDQSIADISKNLQFST